MKALIVTHSNDNESVARVAAALARRGVEAVRFDTDLFPTEQALSVRQDSRASRIELGSVGARIEAGELVGVWHRRLAIGRAIPAELEAQVRAASVEESRRVVNGMLASLPCFVLDPWVRIRLAECKQLQLDLARAAGLDVPRTLITNEPEAVRTFWDACAGRVVTKMMASFAVYTEGRENVVFTNPLKPDDLLALEGLRLCPMTFQEHLEKRMELRVTVVGERVFAASIDSGALPRSKTDWRREGLALIGAWQPCELPAGVERGLLSLMDALGLNYGAADFVVTPEGRTVFLEVNPAGEFFWLERENGLPISEALADVLTGRVARREGPRAAASASRR